jgi:hypothetical protein
VEVEVKISMKRMMEAYLPMGAEPCLRHAVPRYISGTCKTSKWSN